MWFEVTLGQHNKKVKSFSEIFEKWAKILKIDAGFYVSFRKIHFLVQPNDIIFSRISKSFKNFQLRVHGDYSWARVR